MRFAKETEVESRSIGWKPMKMIAEFTAMITATSGAILIDEEVNLGPWGLLATTNRHLNYGFVIEKPDGLGGWVPTVSAEADYSTLVAEGLVPADDPEGYEVTFEDALATPMCSPKLPGGDPWQQSTNPGWGITRGMDQGRDVATANNLGGNLIRYNTFDGDPYPEDHYSRLRLRARRSSRVYSPEEQAVIDALGYRYRAFVYAQDLVAWEVEVPVTAAPNEFLLQTQIELSDFGLTSDPERYVFVLEFRRNGETIRSFLGSGYTPGEELDPPTYPVKLALRGIIPETPWYDTQNGDPLWSATRYGSSEHISSFSDGVWLGDSIGDCSESCKNPIVIKIWREGDLATDYYDGTVVSNEVDLATVPDQTLNGTLIGSTGGPGHTIQAVFVADSTVTDPTSVVAERFAGTGTAGVRVRFVPGVATLVDAFAAIDALLFATVTTGTDPVGVTLTSSFTVDLTPTLTPIAMTPELAAGCTVRLRLLLCPANRKYEYPFLVQGGNDTGIAQIRLRGISPNTRVPPDGLWKDYGTGGDNTLRWGTARVLTDADFILTAPNGTRYRYTANNDGSLNVTEVV